MAVIIPLADFLRVISGWGARVLLVLLLLLLWLLLFASVRAVVMDLLDSHGGDTPLNALQCVGDNVCGLIGREGFFGH